MQIEIAPLKLEEQAVALDIMVQCFGEHMRAAAQKDLSVTFADYPYRPVSFVAKLDRESIGFVQTLSSYFHNNTYSLAWLSVLPKYRRQGLGAILVKAAEDYVVSNRFKGLDGSMMLVSEHTQKYYERLGYLAGLKTHDGYPVMIKHFRTNENR